MVKNNKKSRKTRSDKFPFTLHSTGQFCKKIKGKSCSFGTDKQLALKKYLDQASLKTLCNLYLEHPNYRVQAGEMKLGSGL